MFTYRLEVESHPWAVNHNIPEEICRNWQLFLSLSFFFCKLLSSARLSARLPILEMLKRVIHNSVT